MIKQEIHGESVKERLRTRARDRLFRFSLANATVRGAIVNGTRLVNEMRANHRLGIMETLVLGRAYLGALLMSSNLKGHDRLSLQIDCSGPIKGLVVEANALGGVRGFLKQVPIPIKKPLENFDLSPFFGAGLMTVTRFLDNAKQPFSGNVILQYGNVAKDLAYYYLTSEQVPTAFNLSIQFDAEGTVIGAGGLMLQALPGASEATMSGLENLVAHFPSLGCEFSRDAEAGLLISTEFQAYHPQVLGNVRVEFFCHCSQERVRNMLTLLPIDELKDILDNGPFPVESLCHHCSTAYQFSQEDIQEIYGRRYPNN